MALIILYDVKMKRDRIINTDYIFHCFEYDGGVRINYSEGGDSRDSCTIAGDLQDFAETIGAFRLGGAR